MVAPESIYCINIEKKAFSPSYDLPPYPSPTSVTFQQVVSHSQSPVCRPSSLLTGVGWEGDGAKSYDGEKAWSSIIK